MSLLPNPNRQRVKFALALIATLLSLAVSSESAQACLLTRINYAERESNSGSYGEGIGRQNVDSRLELIGLSTRGIFEFESVLTVVVPAHRSSQAFLRIRSPLHSYQFDAFLNESSNRFSWPTCVLKKAKVEPRDLHAISYTGNGTYLPVIIGNPGNRYRISLFSHSSVKFNRFEIRRQGRVFHRDSRNRFANGIIVFDWDGSNVPAGQYEIYYETENARGYSESGRFMFEHNPNWIR